MRLSGKCLAMLIVLVPLGCGTAEQGPPQEGQGRPPATTGESPRLPQPEQEAEWRAAQADDIYAAVFRHRFEDEFPDAVDEETFYLAVDQEDPSDRLLELLSGEMGVVKKMSDWSDPPGTGKRMGIWSLTWRTNDEVTVEWATREGRCVFSQQCRVVLGSDGWEVADVRAIAAALQAP